MTLEPTPDRKGHRTRIRLGRGQQARFVIALADAKEATEREARLRELASDLVSAGMAPERVRVALQIAAEAPTARDFAAAAAVARQEARALSRATGAPRPVTFGDLVDQWTSGELHRQYPDHVRLKRSADDDASRAERLKRTIGPVPLKAFTLADAERAMAALPEGYSPATRRHYAQIITKVLKFAVYPCKIIEASPLPVGFLPKVSSKLAKAWLYPSEERRLMACREIDLGRRLLYGFLAREGCRLSEAGGLEWSNVDLDRGTLTLDRNKTGDPRSWSMGADVTRALQAYRSRRFQRPEDARGLIFPALPSNRAADALRLDLRRAGVTRPELFERSEVRTPIRAHDLRGTFVTLALAVGRTEAWVTDRTGHSSSAMIYRYKRAARLAAELDTGWFAPLDEAIPELAPRGGESADGTPGETPSGGESEGESTEGAGVTDGDLPDRVSSQKTQCRRRDSNSHEGLPRRILKTAQGSARIVPQGNLPASGTGRVGNGQADSPPDSPPGTNNVPPLGGFSGSDSPPQDKERHPLGGPSPAPADPVEQALARALELASQAGEWATVAELARQLEARRRERAPAPEPDPNIIDLDSRRGR